MNKSKPKLFLSGDLRRRRKASVRSEPGPERAPARRKKSNVLDSKEVRQLFSAEQVAEFRRVFDHFDEDGSGGLSVHEIKTVFKANGTSLSDEEFTQLMVAVDEDGNGTIDFNEFLQAMAMQQANQSHIKSLQHAVQRAIKLTRQVLPVFLPLPPDDARFAAAERQRAAVVRRVLDEKAEQDKDAARKRSAVLGVESQERARERAVGKPLTPNMRFVHSPTLLKFKKAVTDKRSERMPTDIQGEKLSLVEALCKVPVVYVDDPRLCSYEAFQRHDVSLFCPVTDTLVTDVDQTFCVMVDQRITNMALVDENFNPVKVLAKFDVPSGAHSDNGAHICYFDTVVVSRRCQKLFLVSRLGDRGVDVQYEVFCQFRVQTLVEFAASSTTLKDASRALQKASKQHDDHLTLQCAEIVLYFEPTNVTALCLMAESSQRLGRLRVAARAAEVLLGLPGYDLAAKDTLRLTAFEIKAAAELRRGFFISCKHTCAKGLTSFPKSNALQGMLEEATQLKDEQDANDDSLRWAQPDAHAVGCPDTHCKSVASLARYLSAPFQKEVDKVRAFFRWICDKIEYDASNFRYGTYAEGGATPEGVLETRRTVCLGFVNLFQALCGRIGCECVVVTGFGRTDGVCLGDMTVPNHAWNLFKVDGKWHAVDCTWASGSLSPNFTFKHDFNPLFWMTPAPVFLNSHFPEDAAWQLVDRPLSSAEFLRSLCLSPFAIACGLEPASHNASTIVAKAGERIVVRFRDTNPDHVFVHAQLKEWEGLKVVDWGTEVRFVEADHVHEIAVDWQGLKSHKYELTVYAAFHEDDPFTSVASYAVEVGVPG